MKNEEEKRLLRLSLARSRFLGKWSEKAKWQSEEKTSSEAVKFHCKWSSFTVSKQ